MAQATRSRTNPSTRRLSEVARHVVYPTGIVSTGWPRVAAKAEELGIARYDGWQHGLGRLILGKRVDGRYAATVGGVVLSIPRQVGKTFFVGSMLIVLCLLFPGLQVVWTAHRTRTATKTFHSLRAIVRRKKVAPHILHIRTTNGEQEVAFRNGSVIMFGAREQGFGRGFDEIDVEVFDEAQILTDKALEDMVAATNQSRHPHGALLFYMGTPPRPVDPGEVFTAKRADALVGADDMVYVEGSADADCDSDDPEQWAVANWSYPHRTPMESMLRLRKNLPAEDSWRREGLGIWADAAIGVFKPGAWAARATDTPPPPPVALGIAADLDQVRLSLGAASRLTTLGYDPDLGYDRPMHLGLVHRMRVDTHRAAFVAEVKRVQDERGIPVAIDKKGPASFLIPDLEEAHVRLTPGGLDDYVQACADVKTWLEAGAAEHGNYPELNEAVEAATWRTAGDRRVFARKSGDISALEGVTWAAWAASQPAPASAYASRDLMVV